VIQRSIAKRYAKGLFVTGEKNGAYKSYLDQIDDFLSTIEREPKLMKALMLPLLEMEKRKDLLSAVMRTLGLAPAVSGMIQLLLDRNRITYVPVVREVYAELLNAKEGRMQGTLYSAYPVPPEMKKQVEEALGERLKKSVELAAVEDKGLIGGLKVVLGGLRIDGTIKRQLEILNESIMKE
jgi:F-type H+-transporting ATPase subunit delta